MLLTKKIIECSGYWQRFKQSVQDYIQILLFIFKFYGCCCMQKCICHCCVLSSVIKWMLNDNQPSKDLGTMKTKEGWTVNGMWFSLWWIVLLMGMIEYLYLHWYDMKWYVITMICNVNGISRYNFFYVHNYVYT